MIFFGFRLWLHINPAHTLRTRQPAIVSESPKIEIPTNFARARISFVFFPLLLFLLYIENAWEKLPLVDYLNLVFVPLA